MIKTIMIKRREPSTRIAKEISSDIILKIGGCLTATGTPLKGLTFDEEEKYLPQIVGIPKEHLEFTTRVDNWYNKMSINIPYLGLKLVMTLDEDGNPVKQSVKEWLYWKFMLVHPFVAKDKTSIFSSPHYKCYMEDEAEVNNSASNALDEKRKAFLEFSKIVDDEIRLDTCIRSVANGYGEPVGKYIKLPFKEKQVAFSGFMEKNPAKFLKLISDPDLDMKSEIYSMLDFSILTKAGERIIYRSTPIGENIEEAVAYLKSAANSETYAIIKGNLLAMGGALRRKAVEVVKQEEKKLKTVA